MTKKAKANVYVLYTGGTFGMAPNKSVPGEPLEPLELEELAGALPSLDGLADDVNVKVERFEDLMDSSSMTPDDWVKIVERIEAIYESYDGFVVIQGTDTLAYTASAISFMLENLGKPVIVTGSQLPLMSPRSDAKTNYVNSVMVAAYKATNLPLIPEVVVVFADKIIRGCRTRKMSASAMAGFDSPNAPLIGEIGEHLTIYENQIRPAPKGADFQVNAIINKNVLDISLFPGFRAEHLRQILSLANVDGVVFRTYGTGNGPEDAEFLKALTDGISAGDKVVVNITQCPQGTVEMGLYAASVGFIDSGMISGLDMTPEAAMTKMMITMGTRVGEQVKLQMQISQRGEQSLNLFDLAFKTPGKMADNPWSDFVTPDRRFNPDSLDSAVLRIKGLSVGVKEKSQEPHLLDVYMNYPAASIDDLGRENHPRRVHRIQLPGSGNIDVSEKLPRGKIRNIIGDSDATLTFVPSEGVSFNFEKLTLAMFTRP